MSETRVALVACRHLAREAAAVCAARAWTDVTLALVPARCDAGWATWDDLLAAAAPAAGDAELFVVVGAGCLPASVPTPGRSAVHVVRASTCFGLLTNESLVDEWIKEGAYLVTPGWLECWRDAVTGWGYDRATAREHFAEFAKTVRLLETDPASDAREQLAAFADFVNLEPARTVVGTEVLASRVAEAVVNARASRRVEDALVQSAESAMVLDLSSQLMDVQDEGELLARVAELVSMLLPAHAIDVVSLRHREVAHRYSSGGQPTAEDPARNISRDQALTMLPDLAGFRVQLRHAGDALGLIEVTRVSMPEHLGRYANAVLSLSSLCAAAIVRCRAISGIIPICSGCKRVRVAGVWQPVDIFLRSHSNAGVSHGACPECLLRLYSDEPNG